MDVLEESGVRVDSALGGLPPELLAILHFDTLAGTEKTLEQLEARRQAAETAGDLEGLEDCRRAGRRARERSALVAHNPRVRPAVRGERAEIAAWFVVWLQAPEAFASWLELRKKTREFLERFAV